MGKLVDELLAYLSKASKEQLVKDWEELKEFNEVGPEVTSFIEQSLETIQICDSVPEIAISNKIWKSRVYSGFFLSSSLTLITLTII